MHRSEGEHAESLGGFRLTVEPWARVSFVLVQSILEYSTVCFGVAEKHIPLVSREFSFQTEYCKP